MSDKIILGFIGDLAAGKGTVSKYLKQKYQVNSYRFSTMLRDIVDRIYVEQSRENLQNLSTFLRENFGQDVMSRVIAEDVKRDPNNIVAVEGIRRPSDITYLEKMDGFNLIYITADPKIRWERLVKRGENTDDAKKSFPEFLNDEKAEADSLIKQLSAQAKYKILNNGTFDELYSNLEQIIERIKHES